MEDRMYAKKTICGVAEILHETGEKFTEIGLMFKDAETMDNVNEKIEIVSQKFYKLANIEEKAYNILRECI